jgi:hypothetical protein
MKVNKWDFVKHKYEEVNLDYTPIYREDLDRIIECINCRKEIPYGMAYTSAQYHNEAGFGYPVCADCHDKEIELRERSKK